MSEKIKKELEISADTGQIWPICIMKKAKKQNIFKECNIFK